MRVLVVDDEPQVRDTATDLFESFGCHALAAGDGQEALAILAVDPEIALLFTDLHMPGMTGLELAEEVRRRRPDVHIVVTSGYRDDVERNGTEILGKPWRIAEIEAVVAKVRSNSRGKRT